MQKSVYDFLFSLLNLRELLPGKDECLYDFAGRLANYSGINSENLGDYFEDIANKCLSGFGCACDGVVDGTIDVDHCNCEYIKAQIIEVRDVCLFGKLAMPTMI